MKQAYSYGYTVQLKFNFTLARKDTRAFTSFLHGITEYFSSN